MKVTQFWSTWFCLIFGTVLFCRGKPNKSQTEHSSITIALDGNKSSDHKRRPLFGVNCGRTNKINHEQEISNNSGAHFAPPPWNVGVYQYNNNSKNYELICGGSLIAANLVVSAAHCFWEDGTTNNALMINGTYKIAVGKYQRNISVTDSEFTQIIDVELIYVRPDYNGSFGLYFGDVSVLALTTDVEISDAVLPVCIDWNNTYSGDRIPGGSIGKIVGWRMTENRKMSPALMEISLAYVNHTTCKNMYTNDFQYFVTNDKFCASSQPGQEVTEGFSGSGLTYTHRTLQYLTGIVSISDPWTDNSITVFTDVSHHVQWITDIYANYTVMT